MITRQVVGEKLGAYLRHEMPLDDLVCWAEEAMMDEAFDADDLMAVRDAVARLGVADVRMFGLTWEDCEDLLNGLGYSAHVEIVPVV